LVEASLTATRRLLIAAGAALVLIPVCAQAQTYPPAQAHRQWVTVSYNWLYNWPLHFDNFPLEDLVGQEVDEADPPFDYRSRDGGTLVDVVEFKRRGRGVAVTVYPLGMSVGATLGVRGSIENLPDIRLTFSGPGRRMDSYTFTNGLAYDVGAGVYVADRAPGWGLGSYAFLLGGVGRITSDLGGGRRYFAEGGGGLQSGPVGFELSVKFGWNKLSDPVEHNFLSVPLTMRATVSF
jgi:hypothetical protein